MLRDPQLLAEYRRGEKEAFLALYNQYALPLKRFLQGGFSFSSQGRICRFKGTDSGMDVDSLVQETFARAFIKNTRENYDGVRPFQTYLFSIAKNLVLRECHQRERLTSVDHIDETEHDESAFTSLRESSMNMSPEKRFANQQLQSITQNFFRVLTAEEKLYFKYRFAKGFTQEGTAEKMETTRARVKLLEKNVRTRFLKLLRENGYFVDYAPNPRWKRKQYEEAKAG